MFGGQYSFVSGVLLLFVVVIAKADWEDCPDKRKSLGHCLAGLCPFEAECVNDLCCEFPKLPNILPQTVTESTSSAPVTAPAKVSGSKSKSGVKIQKWTDSGEEEEQVLKKLKGRITTKKNLLKKTTVTTTTVKPSTTTTVPQKKKKPKTKKLTEAAATSTTSTTTTTTTTTVKPEVVEEAEDYVCIDGSFSIGECMETFCPEGYACENGYCCQQLTWKLTDPPATIPTTTVTVTIPTSTLAKTTLAPAPEAEDSREFEELSSKEREDLIANILEVVEETKTKKSKKLTTQTPTTPVTVTATSTKKATATTSKRTTTTATVTEMPGTTAVSTTEVPTTTEEDYSTKEVCLIGFPIGECVDQKCPESHECIQNYCCPITPAINCTDVLRSCKQHLCQKPKYHDFMSKNCGRTCRMCDQQKKKPGDERPQRLRRCKDSRNDCTEWVAEGFCQSALYSVEQKRYLCGKSCKLC